MLDCRDPADVPGGWDAVPSGLSSRAAGDTWAAGAGSTLPQVPSVMLSEDPNVLINPLHGDAVKIAATTAKCRLFDPRFFHR